MNESDNQQQSPPAFTLNVDAQIKQAHRQGRNLYLFGASISVMLLVLFFTWLLLVRAYSIIIAPQAAEPTANISIQAGVAFTSGNTVYSLGNQITIVVSAERYETATVNLADYDVQNVGVILQPSPALISADLGEIQGQTSWFIDGNIVHIGAQFTHSLPPGDYELRVDNPYFEVHTQDLSLQRGREYPLDIQLQGIGGQIYISTEPSQADVSVNGQVVGQSSLELSKQGGEYSIIINKKGYEPLRDRIKIVNTQVVQSRNYQLSPLKGQLTFTVRPTGGTLLVNGQQINAESERVAANQEHSVRYDKAGYIGHRQSLSIEPGQDKQISIALQKELGEVTVSSNLPAQVLLNGKSLGSTPQQLTLQALPQRFEFSAPGYRSVSKTVTPSRDKALTVKATLLTEFEARRAEGRPLFISSLGMQMLRFNAGLFTMGSAPNEIGRMRNEYQVEVNFTRPFWVARHEVTQAQYHAFDASVPTSNLPVTNISWLQAAKYTNWLSEQEGLPAFYRINNNRLIGVNTKSNGYRLLTEAEWEWLAKRANRAVSTPYVWGSVERIPNKTGNFADKSAAQSVDVVLNNYDDGFASVAPVGSFAADRAGLFDLAGNVSEWVHDYYTNTPPDLNRTHNDYLGAPRGQQFVVKGANYETGRKKDLRASKRIIGDAPKATVGFRIARYDN